MDDLLPRTYHAQVAGGVLHMDDRIAAALHRQWMERLEGQWVTVRIEPSVDRRFPADEQRRAR